MVSGEGDGSLVEFAGVEGVDHTGERHGAMTELEGTIPSSLDPDTATASMSNEDGMVMSPDGEEMDEIARKTEDGAVTADDA